VFGCKEVKEDRKKALGIYIHIPFCKQKCYYCDFVSYSNKKQKEIQEYVEYIESQIQEEELEEYNVTTIYIGGGTPSFIESGYIANIVKELEFKLNESNNETSFKDIEITMEVNPGTVNKEKLKEYKSVRN